MPLKRLKSAPAKSPFAPVWEIPLFLEKLDDAALLAEIRSTVLAREGELKQKIPAKPIAGIDDGLTSRWHGFNIFTWPEPAMRAFHGFIRRSYRAYLAAMGVPRARCYVQGWANVVRGGEKFAPHCHDQSPYAYLSGNFTVACTDTSTIYYPPFLYQGAPREDRSIPIRNERGLLTLFPSTILHETSLYTDGSERITLAFDIFLQDYDLGGRQGMGGMHIVLDDPAVMA
ncbi:2OG-Fe(II) oxygenase family protein [Limibaculum sp. FT325]|uniref:putative 2OG-Fe(II) oxygenase n=1 Tax=Thermohalobaculum sediminis TaxID=2939436 RepID=UPI0020C0CBFD|nr:putative 2OG-Fe(II) oxygenase [Limibaculum sediminis]MCL5777149.1 2OG-Fe(II) oxygenase family protein [Limibaculum sediminis]